MKGRRPATGPLLVLAFAMVPTALAVLPLEGCTRDDKKPDAGPSPSIQADSDALPADAFPPAASAAPPPRDADCSIAFVSWEGGPAPGTDVSDVPVPLRVPAGANVTIAVRVTGHHVRVRGPAVVRPCTHDENDVVLVASGDVSTDPTAPVRPGAELFLATPAFVAVIPRAGVRLSVNPNANSTYEVDEGEVTFTNLDTSRKAFPKDKGSFKRFENGGLLLTRCGVQTSAAASAERFLLGLAQGDAASPLPSASIGILTAQQVKHARQRTLDCSFAQAFALGCDEDRDAGTCAGGYAAVRAHMASAAASVPVLPGTPVPSASASAPSGSASAPAASANPAKNEGKAPAP